MSQSVKAMVTYLVYTVMAGIMLVICGVTFAVLTYYAVTGKSTSPLFMALSAGGIVYYGIIAWCCWSIFQIEYWRWKRTTANSSTIK